MDEDVCEIIQPKHIQTHLQIKIAILFVIEINHFIIHI